MHHKSGLSKSYQWITHAIITRGQTQRKNAPERTCLLHLTIEDVESWWWLAIVNLSYYFNDRIVTCVPQPNPRCGSQASTCEWSGRQPVPLYVPLYCSYHQTLASASLLCWAVWAAFVAGFCCSILNISNTMCGVRTSFRVFWWCFEGWRFVQ